MTAVTEAGGLMVRLVVAGRAAWPTVRTTIVPHSTISIADQEEDKVDLADVEVKVAMEEKVVELP
jgi:hypothetical protein